MASHRNYSEGSDLRFRAKVSIPRVKLGGIARGALRGGIVVLAAFIDREQFSTSTWRSQTLGCSHDHGIERIVPVTSTLFLLSDSIHAIAMGRDSFRILH